MALAPLETMKRKPQLHVFTPVIPEKHSYIGLMEPYFENSKK